MGIKIRNAGRGTPKFNEGIIASGSSDASFAVYASGSVEAEELVLDKASEPSINFSVDGDARSKISVNTSNNLVLHNQFINKHIVFKVNDQGVTREALRIDGSVSEVVVNQSSESLVDFRVESDNNTHMLFVDGGNDKVGIGTDSPNYALHVAGEIGVDQYIRHNGNPNTHINFTDDKILLKAGNIAMVTAEKKGSAPHEVTINDGGNNIDFVVEDNSGDTLLMTDASNSSVFVGASSTSSGDANFFVSGSTRSRGTSARGTAVFGGDLVVSGTLTAVHKHICTAKYTMDSANREFIRFNAAGSNGVPSVNNKFIAPCQGNLSYIMIRSTGTPGQTTIGFHRATDGTTNLDTTPVDTQSIVMSSADTAYQVNFAAAANFGPGDIVGLSVDPAANHGNVDITLVFELDFVA